MQSVQIQLHPDRFRVFSQWSHDNGITIKVDDQTKWTIKVEQISWSNWGSNWTVQFDLPWVDPNRNNGQINVSDERYWSQLWDVGDDFGHFVHRHPLSLLASATTSLSPTKNWATFAPLPPMVMRFDLRAFDNGHEFLMKWPMLMTDRLGWIHEWTNRSLLTKPWVGL